MLRVSAMVSIVALIVVVWVANIASIVVPILLAPLALPVVGGIYLVDKLRCRGKCCDDCKCG